MVINNLSSSPKPYSIVEENTGSSLRGRVDAKKFVQVVPPGKPPYTVGMECNGIKGIKTADVTVSWYSPSTDGIVDSYPQASAEASE
jgi:hypothetical protein